MLTFIYYLPEVLNIIKFKVKNISVILLMLLVSSLFFNPQISAKQSTNNQKSTPNSTELKPDLTTAAGIEKYLNTNYGGKFILKTSLANVPFQFNVTINKSKFEQYDILVNFNYDVKAVDTLIFENETSIDSLDNARATNTKSQIKKFIQSFAMDLSTQLPKKKIKGQTDGSYYRYPNIKQDYTLYLRNVWVNYDFVDPTSIFADYYGNLADYSETVVTSFKWAPEPM